MSKGHGIKVHGTVSKSDIGHRRLKQLFIVRPKTTLGRKKEKLF